MNAYSKMKMFCIASGKMMVPFHGTKMWQFFSRPKNISTSRFHTKLFSDNNIEYIQTSLSGTINCDIHLLFFRIKSSETTFLGSRESEGTTYKNAFVGSDLIDWLVNNKEVISREEAVKECRKFLENDIIRHGKIHNVEFSFRIFSWYEFCPEMIAYEFYLNFPF